MNQQLESVKLLQDWSKWLVAIQSAACISLWPHISEGGSTKVLLLLAWLAFGMSVVLATALLVVIASYVGRSTANGGQRATALNILAIAQYCCFVVAVIFTATHLVSRATPSANTVSDRPVATATSPKGPVSDRLTEAATKLPIPAGQPLTRTERSILSTLLSAISSSDGGFSQAELQDQIDELSRKQDQAATVDERKTAEQADLALIRLIASGFVKAAHLSAPLLNGSHRTFIVYRITNEGVASYYSTMNGQ